MQFRDRFRLQKCKRGTSDTGFPRPQLGQGKTFSDVGRDEQLRELLRCKRCQVPAPPRRCCPVPGSADPSDVGSADGGGANLFIATSLRPESDVLQNSSTAASYLPLLSPRRRKAGWPDVSFSFKTTTTKKRHRDTLTGTLSLSFMDELRLALFCSVWMSAELV